MKAAPFALATALCAFPALAATQVPVGHFDKISLRGGGSVVVRHGVQQRVTLLKGSTQYTSLHVRDGGELVIDACNRDCPWHYDLEIEIVTPDLKAAAIEGGGHMQAESGFPAQRDFAAAVQGGGHLDMTALAADKVEAAVDGGGHVDVKALRDLTAAVNGGGHITYHGNPQVTQAIDGGGSVSRAE
ncbi:MAG: DUF2807 domain-containing protein [Alphaproteobacteria bacterium]|nr:DUF2807 domain-containing protein [Alphaproteobacteria bacterium]MBV9692928.1 DUF2807 domain-containing protein [Alphaproteobacteria bacterium]